MRYETKLSDAAFFGLDRPVKTRMCESAGCCEPGDYRAPKNRELTEYHWFCLPHVRDYNLNWDYYAGMNEAQIEAEIRNDVCWQRETKPMGSWKQREEQLREKMASDFFSDGEGADMPPRAAARHHMPAAVVAALAVLELEPPADFIRIKAQYKTLVKKHHPDANGGSVAAEARFKDINQAFATLRKIYADEDAP